MTNSRTSFFASALAGIFLTRISDKVSVAPEEESPDAADTYWFHTLKIKGTREQLEQIRKFCQGYDVVVNSKYELSKEFNPLCFASIIPIQQCNLLSLSMIGIEAARIKTWASRTNACGSKLTERPFELIYTFTTKDLYPALIFKELVRQFPNNRLQANSRNDRTAQKANMRSHNGEALFKIK